MNMHQKTRPTRTASSLLVSPVSSAFMGNAGGVANDARPQRVVEFFGSEPARDTGHQNPLSAH
jgi:hypothetical protein